MERQHRESGPKTLRGKQVGPFHVPKVKHRSVCPSWRDWRVAPPDGMGVFAGVLSGQSIVPGTSAGNQGRTVTPALREIERDLVGLLR